MKTMLISIGALLTLLIAIAIYSLWANNVPWNDEPGFWPRLKTYTTQNTAQTADDAVFPELRTKEYHVSATNLIELVSQQCKALGWHIESMDMESLQLHAIVTTKWIKFKDDIRIRVETVSENSSRLHIHSSSRVGRADYAANLGHIIKLQNKL